MAIAELMKDPKKVGIKGLAYNVIRWDKDTRGIFPDRIGMDEGVHS